MRKVSLRTISSHDGEFHYIMTLLYIYTYIYNFNCIITSARLCNKNKCTMTCYKQSLYVYSILLRAASLSALECNESLSVLKIRNDYTRVKILTHYT